MFWAEGPWMCSDLDKALPTAVAPRPTTKVVYSSVPGGYVLKQSTRMCERCPKWLDVLR